MPPVEVLVYDAPTVLGVDENDPDGYIPPDLLLKGIDVRVPIWSKQSPDGKQDRLIVVLERNGIAEFTSRTSYTTPISESEFIIPIGPEFLINDGVVDVSYTTMNWLNNPHPSLPRKLTIDHTLIPEDLAEVRFPGANLHGYLNCDTVPPIWEGVEVKVPPLPDFCRVGDICTLEWFGYLSLNGSDSPIAETYKRIDKRLLSDQEIKSGFSLTVEPYRPHIEPMQNKASAVANYTLYRGTRKIGASIKELVRIDRAIPGEELPCGP
ncbi:hypothetical protein PSH97_14540 [Pseudomonas cucumis]|uniref:Minor tail protein n=1 Tax=Pseudomonas cucumis TaxID=2954082 RepID=A0ABY9ENV1_9PSED|nr:hypothetical protein [Pseudomonas cucumis]WLG82366.1 hypothetical protein PSH97_14540 [Pseudomonas cucumis]